MIRIVALGIVVLGLLIQAGYAAQVLSPEEAAGARGSVTVYCQYCKSYSEYCLETDCRTDSCFIPQGQLYYLCPPGIEAYDLILNYTDCKIPGITCNKIGTTTCGKWRMYDNDPYYILPLTLCSGSYTYGRKDVDDCT
jgi:hypothetical protein